MDEVNVVKLVKDNQTFMVIFDDDQIEQAIKILAKYAANPDLIFSWYDAACLAKQIRIYEGG